MTAMTIEQFAAGSDGRTNVYAGDTASATTGRFAFGQPIAAGARIDQAGSTGRAGPPQHFAGAGALVGQAVIQQACNYLVVRFKAVALIKRGSKLEAMSIERAQDIVSSAR